MVYSFMFILGVGFLGGKLFQKLKLPGVLGMIIAGVLGGPYVLNQISENILIVSKDIRKMALIIILLRAGLGLHKDSLKKVGKMALKMTAIPCIIEGTVITFVSYYLLKISIYEAGMLGFIIAAVSPAVVVPAMLDLKERKLGTKEEIPTLILAGASADDIFAITIFGAFLSMGTMKRKETILKQISLIPLEIVGGILLGFLLGIGISLFLKKYKNKLRPIEVLLIIITVALGITLLGEALKVSGLLAVMTIGFVLYEKDSTYAQEISKGLSYVWVFAEIFLFVLIGAAVNIQVAIQAGMVGLGVLFIGLIGRSIGVFISTAHSHLNHKERLFCAIAYTPKATVQAAIGGIPLAMGVENGELILAIAVLAIMVTAPLGAIGIKIAAPKLLKTE